MAGCALYWKRNCHFDLDNARLFKHENKKSRSYQKWYKHGNIKVIKKKIPGRHLCIYIYPWQGVRSRIYSSRIKDRDWRKNKFTNSHTSKSTLIKK